MNRFESLCVTGVQGRRHKAGANQQLVKAGINVRWCSVSENQEATECSVNCVRAADCGA